MTSKLIRLRVESCGNGDDCPALDRCEEGGIEVTGKLVHRPGLGPGEGTVLVPDRLLPEIASLHVDLGTFIAEHHHTDLLRVQTLDRYGVASTVTITVATSTVNLSLALQANRSGSIGCAPTQPLDASAATCMSCVLR